MYKYADGLSEGDVSCGMWGIVMTWMRGAQRAEAYRCGLRWGTCKPGRSIEFTGFEHVSNVMSC